ncbi:MAG: hypothetical protein H7Y27_15175 [Gemmatimonadaceae bacterium]|nr:hypothetical protein [Chitinophagaceae bacterium]
MKNLRFLLALVLMTSAATAQSDKFHFPDAFYFVKEINVESLRERPFHFEISVKENPSDTFSRPRIYAIQVRKGKEDIIGKTLTYAEASGGDWKKYTIDGIVDNEATRIWLYVAVNGNGEFYFDNLQYSVADNNGTLMEKDLSNASFEDRKLLSGYFMSRKPAENLRISLSPVATEGKQSVLVVSSNQKPGIAAGVARN